MRNCKYYKILDIPPKTSNLFQHYRDSHKHIPLPDNTKSGRGIGIYLLSIFFPIFFYYFLINFLIFKESPLGPSTQSSLDAFTTTTSLRKRPSDVGLSQHYTPEGLIEKVLYFLLENSLSFSAIQSQSFRNLLEYTRE